MNLKLFLLSLVITLTAHSQGNQNTISGKVLDNFGEPIFGATVAVDNNLRATITNEKGFYILNNIPEGKHLINTSYMGFIPSSKEVSFGKNEINKKFTLNFTLTEKVETLNQVYVQGKTQKRKIEEQGFSANVIETEEAGLRNIQTNELLRTSVGVNIRQNGGLGSDVQYSLNGLSGSAVRVFIDGIPISVYGSSFSLNSLPPSMIKQIEVYKGVVPGYLADDALGGAINVVLHKGANSNINASVSYGSFNTMQTSFNGLYRMDESGFTVKASGFYNYSDNDYEVSGKSVVETGLGGVQTPITARRFNDAYKSLGGMIQVGFTNVMWADQFFVGITGSDDYKEVQHGAFMTITPYKDRFLESDAMLGNLTYQKKDLFTEGLDVNVNGLYGTRNRIVNDTVAAAYSWTGDRAIDWEGKEFEYIWGSQQEGGPTLAKINRKVASVRAGVSYEINSKHKILLNYFYSGIDREDSDELKSVLENTFVGTRDLNKNISSLTYEFSALENKLKVNVFGKYYQQKTTNIDPDIGIDADGNEQLVNDVTESNNSDTGYGFALSYAVLPKVTLLASAEKAVRLPDEIEVFGNDGDNVVANPNIRPEQSNNYNLGFSFGNFNIKKHNFTVSTNIFLRDIKDRIGLPIETSLNVNDETILYVNQGSGTSKGIEAQLNYTFDNNLAFNFNFSRFDLKVVSEGIEIDVPNTPFFTMNGGLHYSFSNLIQKNTQLNLFYNIYFTDDFSYLNIEGENNTGAEFFEVPQQLAQDIGLSYSFPNNKFVMSFDIKNIFDSPVYDNLSVQKPGRAFYLKLNYSINKY